MQTSPVITPLKPLKPNKILQYVTDSEEEAWKQAGITQSRDDLCNKETLSIGRRILRHGKTVKLIHNYFGDLEPRKCCLHLTSCKTTFSNVRLVRNDGRDSGIEEGAMMRTPVDNTITVNELDDSDFQVFKYAYLCASLPVLGAPEPPSALSPSPVFTPTDSRRRFHFTKAFHQPPTPTSLQDSGMEDQDDTSIVPAESLRELLMRTFRLTPERFYYYEQRIANMYNGKQAERILAEELVGQLAALENNNNPFYSPDTFMHAQGYDKWQRWEFLHIGELMKKFWHHSYPPPSNHYVHFLKNVHTDYRMLMEKFIRYESPYRQAGELLAPGQTSPLSTTSVRLLKEFGLRYGIGEFYRRIVYLHYLVNNFDATVWFIQHTGAVLSGILDMLPKRGAIMVLVKKEHILLEESIQTLETQVVSTLLEMKSLFPNNKPAEGLESLIQLISRALLAKRSTDKLENFLLKNVKNIFPTCYNREKMVVMTDLSNSSNDANTDLSPTLLNLMICKIRDEVNDYKIHYQSTFEKFFDVTSEAAQSLYKLLMDDIKLLCHSRQSDYSSLKIDKLMLGLGYRLHQLDQEWTTYISTDMQTWREVFVKEEIHWSVALKVRLQAMVVKSVSQDDFDTDNVAATEIPSAGSSDSSMIYQRVRTVSTKSLTPSFNSAFSGLVLSSQSTPDNQKISRQSSRSQSQTQFPTIPESDQLHPSPPKQTFISNSDLNQNFSDLNTAHHFHTPSSMSRRRRQNDYNFETQSLEAYLHSPEEIVSFTCIRQSSSLPDVLSKSYDHTLNVPRTITKDRIHDDQNGSATQFNEETENKPQSAEDVQNFLSLQARQVGLGDDKDSLAGEFSGSNSEDTLTDPRDEDYTASERSDSGEAYLFPPIEIVSMDKKQMQAAPVTLTSQGQSTNETHSTPKVKPNVTSNGTHHQTTTNEIAKSFQEMKEKSNMLQIPAHGHIPEFHQYHSLSDSGDHSQGVETSLPVSSNSAERLEVPVSSSLVDLISMMQRLVGFSRVICLTFCPLNTPTLAPIDDDINSFSISLDDVTSNYNMMSDTRQNLYNNFFDALSNTLCVYGDNMLCMDLCGTTLSVARKLAGPQLVEYLMTQQDGGLVWGCRHDTMKVKDCFFYVDRKTDFLCDRYEPITRDMCTRINNVAAVLECLDVFHSELGRAFNVYNDWRVYHKRRGQHTTSDQSNDYEIVDSFSYNPESDRHVVMETASQITSTTTSSLSSHSVIVQTPTKPCHDHLKAVLRALSRIMAYRLNLFASDALRVLLGLKHADEPVQTCLQPLTKFLQMYINSLQSWLYPDCFRRVVECLWIFIVQDFEEEVKKLISDENTEVKARIFIQALSHLLWFITQQDQSIGKNLLLSQAEDVMFKLQLFTESTSQLITLFRGLQQHYAFCDSSSTCSVDGAIQVMLHRMRKDLQVYCKCFSGHALMDWIMTNPKLFANIWEPRISVEMLKNNRHNCFAVAQWLLDQGLIVDMITELDNPYETTLLMNSYGGQSEEDEYPALSIHSSMHGVTSGDSDNDTPKGSPEASQRSTPVPTTRNQGSRVGTPVQRSRPSSRAPNLLQKCLSRKDTPLPKFENLSGRPEDFSFTSLTSSLSEVSQIECANGSVHPDEVKALTGNTVSSHVNQENIHVDEITVDSEGGEGSRGVANLNDIGGYMTPKLDLMLENVIFQHDKCHFYHIATVLGSGLQRDNGFTSARDRFELNNLIEQCFLKKIIPDYILTILHSRRKEDPDAKMFSQKLLEDPSHKFSINKQEKSTCVTS